MEMDFVSGLAVYLIFWWLVLFTTLPVGNQPIDQEDIDKGHAPSAPKKPRILIKMAATTMISGVLFAGFYWAMAAGMMDFRGG